jgi:hypothetical protein
LCCTPGIIAEGGKEDKSSAQKAPSGDEDDEEIDVDYDCLDV